MLLNEQNGYFHQVPGWDLNCAVVGAVLAELSLRARIDTDVESLVVVDETETGSPALDPILKQIADEPLQRNAQYWIERLALHAESVIDLILDRLVDLKILKHHDGEFWTLIPTKRYTDLEGNYKERALNVHIVRALPRFMLNTPGMTRRAKFIDTLLGRVQSVHTPAQRAGCPRNLADDLLSLHASDPQLVPESNLRFALSAALIASVYLGDALSFAVYAMASQPALYARIRGEADALFDKDDPAGEDITPSAIDVTHRFLMECLRVYPIVPMSMRDVMNTCVVEGYELPVGARIYIAQTASHFMDEIFPEPFSFDIDRYLPPRNEHRGPGYAPYGLGTHRCLGSRWMDLQLAINVLMIARYFRIEVSPAN